MMHYRATDLTPEMKLKHWGPGEWVDEADFCEFIHKGYHCMILRNAAWDGHKKDILSLGNLCGYITIPKDHPWYGVDFFKEGRPDVDVHGGITFNEGDDEGHFWIGFDCGHSGDVVPSNIEMKEKMREEIISKYGEKFGICLSNSPIFRKSYKNINYVVNQLKSLVEQAKEAEK
jgi:hypothetical protein